jgi:hypothetical protein
MIGFRDPKQCTKCKEFKPRTEFQVDKRRPRGVQSMCILCANQYKKDRYWADVETSRERNNKRAKLYREKLKQCPLSMACW